MSAFTRVTVVGSAQRCELAVPSEEPLAAVLPRVLELVGEPAGTGLAVLGVVRDTGEAVVLDRSPAEQQLLDGTVLRLVPDTERPAPPEVSDVTDELGVALALRRDRWSDPARWTTAVAGVGALATTGATLASNVTAVLLAVAVLLSLAILAGHLAGSPPVPAARQWPAIALTAAALGASLPAAVDIGVHAGAAGGATLLAVHTTVALVTWIVLALGIGVGLAREDVLVGGLLGAAAVAAPLLVAELVSPEPGPERAAAVGAVTAVLACGLLTRLAVSSAGLAGLDDQTLAGELAGRPAITQSVSRAYSCLSWSVAGVASGLVASTGVLLASPDPWSVGLGACVAIVTALRTRTFPLVAQHAVLWLAVAGALTIGWTGRPQPPTSDAAVGLAVLAALVVMSAAWRPPEHVRAWLRRLGNLLETLAVVALPPLVLGLFGVYQDLLGRFA
jgi:WXG100 protein secretion system (Wss), protein YukD